MRWIYIDSSYQDDDEEDVDIDYSEGDKVDADDSDADDGSVSDKGNQSVNPEQHEAIPGRFPTRLECIAGR
nr:hypothetical protein [Tanacetum cinerariifolium]